MPKKTLLITLPVAIGLAGLLLLQLQWSSQRLLAELKSRPALVQMERWSDADIDPDNAQWQPVMAQLMAALQHRPEDPELLARVGDLYTLRLSDDALTDAQIDEAQAQGGKHYRLSLAQRPTWVRDWDDLALIKYNQGLYQDEDYQLALRQMARFGRHRSNMMELLRDISISSWSDLGPKTRQMVAGVVEIVPLSMVAEGPTDLDLLIEHSIPL